MKGAPGSTSLLPVPDRRAFGKMSPHLLDIAVRPSSPMHLPGQSKTLKRVCCLRCSAEARYSVLRWTMAWRYASMNSIGIISYARILPRSRGESIFDTDSLLPIGDATCIAILTGPKNAAVTYWHRMSTIKPYSPNGRKWPRVAQCGRHTSSAIFLDYLAQLRGREHARGQRNHLINQYAGGARASPAASAWMG